MRKSDFITRLKVASWIIYKKQHRDLMVMTCEKCNSLSIVAVPDTEIRNIVKGKLTTCIWMQKYKCQHCGAECEEVQQWRW